MSMTDFVRAEDFESYRSRFAQHAELTRDDGILEVRFHTRSGSAFWSLELHNALPELFKSVGADRSNEVVIVSGTGAQWLAGWDEASLDRIERPADTFARESYQRWFRDGTFLQENLLTQIDVPTIGVINGPGFHTEFGLLCDITLCADDVVFFDRHFVKGFVPGDGLFLVLQELVGLKRANHMILTGEGIDAAEALRIGLVNEVMPRDDLAERARELARAMLGIDPIVRRLTSHIVKRPWLRRFGDDFRLHFGYEMWGSLVHRHAHSNES